MPQNTQKLLVLGATGYLGSVATEHLTAAGHRVVALRHPGRHDARTAKELEVRPGDIADPTSLADAVSGDIDGVLHFVPPTGDPAVDVAAIEALLAQLRGTGRLLVYVSGTWVLGASGREQLDEDSPTNPIELVSYRPELERLVRDAAVTGVRSVVMRAGVVHGRGGGIPAMMVDWARSEAEGRYVGTASVRWPMVHVDDVGDLVTAIVEHARPGMLLHAVAEPAVPVVELANAAARAVGASGAQAWPAEHAYALLGRAFADALALDQNVRGERARRELEWRPRGVDAVTDLATGSYRRSPAQPASA